jgi:hypothetical protein
MGKHWIFTDKHTKAAGIRGRRKAQMFGTVTRRTPSLPRVRFLERPIVPATERERTGKAPTTPGKQDRPARFLQSSVRTPRSGERPPSRTRLARARRAVRVTRRAAAQRRTAQPLTARVPCYNAQRSAAARSHSEWILTCFGTFQRCRCLREPLPAIAANNLTASPTLPRRFKSCAHLIEHVLHRFKVAATDHVPNPFFPASGLFAAEQSAAARWSACAAMTSARHLGARQHQR